jgi:hypothetical protein
MKIILINHSPLNSIACNRQEHHGLSEDAPPIPTDRNNPQDHITLFVQSSTEERVKINFLAKGVKRICLSEINPPASPFFKGE